MKRQTKKLTLDKETLRDLTAQNAGLVKGGYKSHGKGCYHWTRKCTTYGCW